MYKELGETNTNHKEGKWLSVGPDSKFHTGTGVLDLKIPGQARKIVRLAAERQISTGSLSASTKNSLIDYCVYLINIYATREAFPQHMLGVGDFDRIVEMQDEINYLKDHHGQDIEDDALYGAKALIALGMTVNEAVKKIEAKHKKYVVALLTGELSDKQIKYADSKFREVVLELYLHGTSGDKELNKKPKKVQSHTRIVESLDAQKRKEHQKPDPDGMNRKQRSASEELFLPDNW